MLTEQDIVGLVRKCNHIWLSEQTGIDKRRLETIRSGNTNLRYTEGKLIVEAYERMVSEDNDQ